MQAAFSHRGAGSAATVKVVLTPVATPWRMIPKLLPTVAQGGCTQVFVVPVVPPQSSSLLHCLYLFAAGAWVVQNFGPVTLSVLYVPAIGWSRTMGSQPGGAHLH